MVGKILTIIVLLAAVVGLVYSIRQQQKDNRCAGCSLKEVCRRNESECTRK